MTLPTPPAIPVFPTLPAGFPVKISPVMDTTIGTTKSLREIRVANQIFPLWDFELLFEELRDQTQNNPIYAPFAGYEQYMELAQLFIMMYGQGDVFYFDAPWDDSRTLQLIANGDGTTKTFTAVRTWGQGAFATMQPVGGINVIYEVRINNIIVSLSDYSFAGNEITFVVAPGADLSITMTFSFYYLCRFVEDELDFEEFGKNRWAVPSLKLRSVNDGSTAWTGGGGGAYIPTGVMITTPPVTLTISTLSGLPSAYSFALFSVWIYLPDDGTDTHAFQINSNEIFFEINNDQTATPQITVRLSDGSSSPIVHATYDLSSWSNWVNILISADTPSNVLQVYAGDTALTPVAITWSSTNQIGNAHGPWTLEASL